LLWVDIAGAKWGILPGKRPEIVRVLSGGVGLSKGFRKMVLSSKRGRGAGRKTCPLRSGFPGVGGGKLVAPPYPPRILSVVVGSSPFPPG